MRAERWIYTLPLRLRSLFRRSRVEQELDEELRAHLEWQTQANLESGMPEEEARWAALRAMGGLEQRKEECRDTRGVLFLEELAADVRYALRSLRRTPTLAAVVIVSMALGIGANTAIFSVLNTVMLARLPVQDPERLVQLTWSAADWPAAYIDDLEGSIYQSRDSPEMTSYSFPSRMFEAFAAPSSTLEAVFAFAADDDRVNVGLAGRALDARLQAVSGGFFQGLGVRAAAGRAIVPSDDSPGAPPVAVASYRFWQRQMGADPQVAGRTVVVNGTPVTLAGVAPPEFFGFARGNPPDLWVPLSFHAAQWRQLNPDQPLDNPRVWWLGVVGRLKPGVTRTHTLAELSLAFQQNLEVDPKASNTTPVPRFHVVPAKRGLDRLQRSFSTSLWLLMAMVFLLLLIACANVAGLLLARATARQPEIATRMSLGAPRLRIVRQLLTESIVLALLGGMAGLLVAVAAASALAGFLASSRDRVLVDVPLDGRVILFTAAVSLACGVLFGLLPALRITRADVFPTLKGARVTGGGRTFRTGKVLVAAQVGLGLLLVIGSGLMVRTLRRLQSVDIGFERERLLVFEVKPGLNGYRGQALANYYEELQRRLAAIPGVRSAAFSMLGPIGSGFSNGRVEIPGVSAPGTRVDFHRHFVGARYFETLGVPVLAGRAVGLQDVETAARIAVVNETFVRQHFHGASPIGRILRQGSAERPLDAEVVGVVGDVKYNQLRDEVPPTAYFSYRQASRRADYVPVFMNYLVRTQGDPRRLVGAVERAAFDLDANVPLAGIRTETEIIDQVLFLERAFAWLASGFGILALALACVGLIGTIGYTVAQRTNEIGIRMALGAGRTTILALVLRETLVVVVGGIVAGIPLAWAATRLLRARLFELSPHDPVTVAASVVCILVATLAAGFLPARRAARIDPMVALRYE